MWATSNKVVFESSNCCDWTPQASDRGLGIGSSLKQIISCAGGVAAHVVLTKYGWVKTPQSDLCSALEWKAGFLNWCESGPWHNTLTATLKERSLCHKSHSITALLFDICMTLWVLPHGTDAGRKTASRQHKHGGEWMWHRTGSLWTRGLWPVKTKKSSSYLKEELLLSHGLGLGMKKTGPLNRLKHH